MAMTAIWAHRGASGYAPENTLPAFELAIAQGADGVEFDVQLSSDGVPVVIHDETLGRTTSGSGAVGEHTLAQLQSLDASAGRSGFEGVHIPTLQEVLEVVAPTSLTVNVELKNSEVDYPGLEEKVLAAIAAFGIEQRVVLSSFNHYSLRRLRDLHAPSQLAVLSNDPLFKPWKYAAQLGATAIHPPVHTIFGRSYVRKATASGVVVRPWVVNADRTLRRMFRYGVDAVITDIPDVALALRAES
ncbi:MAG: glycerophosphodiester phosphodiesterase [Propionicimonas sp.]|uniref:glycerophosphodiester phosphodiesterase n=1 Tax=Propionicimonas sp. TaxID=1955623 RepID=UPI002B1FEF3F|nr:glycerophosphodiester phosphodiesterase [Propionicimonas sp.]MEA4943922.1 glycerophosphodiester phosphodiesterase [Propionicimonas sp.]MEA5053424.1 glycerophosphodiester phosphodiesterase [Propionicimonas sp.]MEA5118968.1 glycerophosphodiester phosphodiesterase [Propionicimonas sp.]